MYSSKTFSIFCLLFLVNCASLKYSFVDYNYKYDVNKSKVFIALPSKTNYLLDSLYYTYCKTKLICFNISKFGEALALKKDTFFVLIINKLNSLSDSSGQDLKTVLTSDEFDYLSKITSNFDLIFIPLNIDYTIKHQKKHKILLDCNLKYSLFNKPISNKLFTLKYYREIKTVKKKEPYYILLTMAIGPYKLNEYLKHTLKD
ncbi:MAG: hypothetical protein JXA77_01155 [Bacteroidales bacterium]|nr:hypothetical protein [Bacteroidales bacterium]